MSPPLRSTPRLKVAVKSGFSTMATVMGSQYVRCQLTARPIPAARATQTARRTACRKAADSKVRFARRIARLPRSRSHQGVCDCVGFELR